MHRVHIGADHLNAYLHHVVNFQQMSYVLVPDEKKKKTTLFSGSKTDNCQVYRFFFDSFHIMLNLRNRLIFPILL